jgi:hypothetical protein
MCEAGRRGEVSTLFFTRYMYAIHVVTHVTSPPLRGDRNKEQCSMYMLRRRKESQKVTDNSLRDRIQGNWKQLSGGVRHE